MRSLLFFLVIILFSCGSGRKSHANCVQYSWDVPQNEPLIYTVIYSELSLDTSLNIQNGADTQYDLIYNHVLKKQNEANKFIVMSRRPSSNKLIDVSIISKYIDPLSLKGEYRYDVYKVIMDINGNITQKQLNAGVSNFLELFLKLGCFSNLDSTFRETDFIAFLPTLASTLEIDLNNVVRVTELSTHKCRFEYNFQQKFLGLANSDTINSKYSLKAYSEYMCKTKQLDGFYGYAELVDIFGDEHRYVLGLIPVDADSVLTNLHYTD